MDLDGGELRLSGGHWQPVDGAANMGLPIADPRLGGGRRADLGEVLPCGSPGNAPFWYGNVVRDPPAWKILWGGGGGFTTR